jgi:hypothetical protein
MSIDAAPEQSAPETDPPGEAFDLERFDWAGPDRLELAGTFAGLGDAPADAPVLVVHGADRVHRLPAVDAEAPEVGRPWQAAFAWQEMPEPFDAAELELGGLTIALPAPGAKRTRLPQPTPSVARSEAPDGAPDGARQIGLEAELLTAQEEIRELRIEADRNRDELEQARRALAAERDRRSADAERFRAGIAQFRASAEEALAGERAARLEAVDRARDAAGAASADAERLVIQLAALRSALAESS